MCRASHSLVRACANLCRVRGIDPVNDGTTKVLQSMLNGEQVGHGNSASSSASRNYFTAAAILYVGKRYGQNVLQPNVVSISSSLVWKAVGFQNV